jgi:cobalamin biosynthesis Mg chelatase CobN
VQPGDSATETVDVSVDEPGVPFKESAELKIALVTWDDPYATRPLAETMVTVGETVENETGDGTDGGTPNSEKNTETQSNSESDDGTGESANDNETVNEAEDERNDQTGSSEESPSESGGSESNSEASPGVTDTASSSEQSNDDGIPALGIGGLIAGLGGVGYLLRQRLILDNDQHD